MTVSTVQYRTVQYSTVQYSAVQYSTVQYSITFLFQYQQYPISKHKYERTPIKIKCTKSANPYSRSQATNAYQMIAVTLRPHSN